MGISIDVRLLQAENKPTLILVRALDSFTEVRYSQFWKALSPIEVTEFGISIEVSLLYKKAYSPMLVTVLGITKEYTLLQL